jgi:hypothetical protein
VWIPILHQATNIQRQHPVLLQTGIILRNLELRNENTGKS